MDGWVGDDIGGYVTQPHCCTPPLNICAHIHTCTYAHTGVREELTEGAYTLVMEFEVRVRFRCCCVRQSMLKKLAA
jgi:hypothetical protein